MDMENLNQQAEQEAQAAAQEQPENQPQQPDEPQDLEAAMFGGGDAETETDDAAQAQPAADEQAAATDKTDNAPEAEEADGLPEDLQEPEGLGEKASARFQALANEVKEHRAKAEQYEQMSATVAELQQQVRESFNNADELTAVFDYAKAVKTGDFDTVERYLVEQIRQFEALSGRSLDAGLLGAYPDLQQQLDDMELSPQAARELAAARYRQQREQEARQAWQQQQQAQLAAQQQDEAVRLEAAQALNALADKWAREDVMWPEVEGKVLAYARQYLGSISPQQWPAAVEAYYRGLKAQPVPKPPAVQPLRGGGMQGGQRTPQSLEEAMFGNM